MAINFNAVLKAVRMGIEIFQKASSSQSTPTRQSAPSRPRNAGSGPRPQSSPRPQSGPAASAAGSTYPGDFRGTGTIHYAPAPDGNPDPGEIVWAWVPYEEDYSQGKDRPVLLIGSTGSTLLGLMLTSKDHVPAASTNGSYVDVGTGPWDRQGRPSEVLLDRVLQLRPDSIRREGAVLDRARFDQVAAVLRQRHGWK